MGEPNLAEGKSSEIRLIRSKLVKNLSCSEIADLLELPEAYISNVANLIQSHSDDSDVQIAQRYLTSTK